MLRLLAALVVLQDAAPDRADLPRCLESWYRILEGDQTMGYLHERLERLQGLPWRYDYRLRMEMELWVAGPEKKVLHREELAAEAYLDDAFAPVYLNAATWVNEARTSRTILPAGDERRLEVSAPGAEPRTVELPAGGELHALPSLALYAMRQGGQLARPGPRRLQVLSPAGDRASAEMGFEAGPLERRVSLGRSVPVTRITFLKAPPATRRETEWAEAWVDRYGRILELRTRGGLRLELAEGEESILETRLFLRYGRRDPFAKEEAMRRAAPPLPGAFPPSGPDVTKDSFLSVLNRAEKLLEELRERKEAGQAEEAEKGYQEILRHWKALREKAPPEHLARLDELRKRAEDLWPGAAGVHGRAGRLFIRAAEGFDREEYSGLEEGLAELRRLRDRIELEDRAERLDLLVWVSSVETLAARARVRRELAAKRLSVTAVTLGGRAEALALHLPLGALQEVSVVRPVALCAVNGRTYEAGQVVEDQGVKVEKIDRFSVTFSLRGESRTVPLGR